MPAGRAVYISRVRPLSLCLSLLALAASAGAQVAPPETPAAPSPAAAPRRVLTFREALARARNDAPAVLSAMARARAAEAQIDGARGAWYPTVSVSSSPSFGFSDRPFLPRTALPGVSDRLQNVSTGIDGTVQARFPIYDFGRTAANVESARRGYTASQEDARVQAFQAMSTAAVQYLTVLNDREAINSVRVTVTQREAQLRIAEGLVERGARPPIERTRAQVNLDAARLDLVSAEARELVDRANLAAAVGLDPTEEIDLAPVDEADMPVDDDPTRAANAAVAARPEFAAARARLLQSESQLEAARAQRRPTLSASASGSVSYAAVLTGNGLAGISESVNAGLNFSWPVFDATARANIVTAERNLEAARAALDAQSMQVRAAAVQAALSLRTSRAALAQAERLATGAAANLEQADGRYRAGAAPLLELVDAQAADASARAAVVRAHLSLSIARAQLLGAVGGLDRLATPR